MSTRVILVTPGLTPGSRAGIFGVDEPLDAHGVAAATRVRHTLGGRSPGLILAGPETQCTQTAQIIAAAPDRVRVDPRLRGWDHGRWTGRSLQDVAADEPAELGRWRAGAGPAGAESLPDLVARAGGWLGDLPALTALAGTEQPTRPRQVVVAVATTAVVRACILHTLHADLSAFWNIDVEPAARVDLALSTQGPCLRWVAAPARTVCDQDPPGQPDA